ncbi:NAD(P)/FAD-dependent oxidoreductase [Flavobacteriaceae bacterium TP-CH-4]|uniref:NADH:ubiquinone reductase (non-electrogenic) n=1 Tax=Pelagihabitans pacificus TaxID=2696054 RepID=A0A967AXB8_9FLAO|nr:NAD(P)/FAD-dependent oxidoreductase [Pelagihabitans pacificus]NHF61040.1 NAD(P)/FAD-dependent oxidoreductase [Pelagihabitans pacificus]
MTPSKDYPEYGLQIPKSEKARIIVVGGGFGGLNFLKTIPKNQFQIVLFDKHNYHTFIPLLYQVATSALEAPSIADPHRRIYGKRNDVFFRSVKVIGIQPEEKIVETFIGTLEYDFLVLASGSVPNYFGNKSLMKNAYPLKSLPDATALRSKIYQNLEEATLTKSEEERKRLMNFVIVGGGPTGVEVAGALSELRKYVLPLDYKDLDLGQMQIKIVEGADKVLGAFSSKSSKKALGTLKKMGVRIIFDRLVSDFDGTTITYENGEKEKCGMLIWGAGVSGAIINGLKDETVKQGRYITDPYCRIKGYNTIFAIGDVAFFEDERYEDGLPGVAQTAIQQGKYTAKLLSRITKKNNAKGHTYSLEDESPFRYFDKGSLATIGRNKAVADLPMKLKFSGFIAWLLWAVVHLFYLNGLRNRLLTFLNWVMNYFNYENKVRLIIHPTFKTENVHSNNLAEETNKSEG